MPPPDLPAPFRLLRWFAGLSALVIALIAVANAWVVSNFLTDQLFQREADVSREFVQNVLLSDGTLDYLRDPGRADLAPAFQNSVAHLGNIRDVLRANVYRVDRSMLWSTDAKLIGRRFTDNEELEEALSDKLVVHAGRIADDAEFKREYEGLSIAAAFFVETYIPVHAVEGGPVVGVVELYKAPLALTEAIRDGQRRVALAAFAGALVLYFSLFWLVRRADRTLHGQQARLREAETLAAIGELASSVAHNIRNPLASIRSSAELSLELPQDHAEDGARDIIREVDRISGRINDLLRLSSQLRLEPAPVDLVSLLRDCVADHEAGFRQRQQALELDCGLAQAMVMADANLLQQVLHSLLANASEAMGPGQRCGVRLKVAPGGRLHVEIQDQGQGMSAEALQNVFRPFFTTKPKGLGLGLTLARRIVERTGGRLALQSEAGRGTRVLIDLPAA